MLHIAFPNSEHDLHATSDHLVEQTRSARHANFPTSTSGFDVVTMNSWDGWSNVDAHQVAAADDFFF